MRLLVTGAAGRIGAAVVAAAAGRGIEVVGHDLADGDLCDPDVARTAVRVARPDAVVNAAGLTYGPEADLWRLNLLVPLRLLDALAGPGGRRLVQVGSAAEYGLTGEGRVGEGHPCRPNSTYGLSKLAAGELVRGHPGVTGVVARLFNLIAEPHDERSLLGRVEAGYRRGEDEPAGAAEVRDFVPLAAAANALVGLALADITESVVVNVCTGTGRTAAEVLGRPRPARPGSASVGDPTRLHALTGLDLSR